MKSLHASMDEVSHSCDSSDTDDAPPACRVGCSHCCHARVEVSDPEAFYIARQLPGLPASHRESLIATLRVNAAQRASSPSSPVPCAFLSHEMCLIYEHRPATCRKAHSLSVRACANQAAQIPQNLHRVLQHEVLIEGTNRAYLANGLPAHTNELSAAVLAVLTGEVNADDWYCSGQVQRQATC
jgi:Fe-S-cluster containining protein